MVAGVPMNQGTRAGGVVGQHAADRADLTARRVGGEAAADFGKTGVESVQSNAGLNTNGGVVDFKDFAKVPAEIDNETPAQRLARHAGARAARDKRQVVLKRVARESAHILFVAWHGYANGLYLKDAG